MDDIKKHITKHEYEAAEKVAATLGDGPVTYSIWTRQGEEVVEHDPKLIRDYVHSLVAAKGTITSACEAEAKNYEGTEKYEFLIECFGEESKVDGPLKDAYYKFRSPLPALFGVMSVSCKGEGTYDAHKSYAVEVFDCYLKEQLRDFTASYEKEAEIQEALAEKKREADEKIRLAKNEQDNKDGTTNLNTYCGYAQSLEILQNRIANERKIASEVGVVNQSALYKLGQTVVFFKEGMTANQKEYTKKTGKPLSRKSCK